MHTGMLARLASHPVFLQRRTDFPANCCCCCEHTTRTREQTSPALSPLKLLHSLRMSLRSDSRGRRRETHRRRLGSQPRVIIRHPTPKTAGPAYITDRQLPLAQRPLHFTRTGETGRALRQGPLCLSSGVGCVKVAYKVALWLVCYPFMFVFCPSRTRTSSRAVRTSRVATRVASRQDPPTRSPSRSLPLVAARRFVDVIAVHTHPSRKITTAVSCEQSVDGIIVENAHTASLRVAPRPLARSHTQCALGSQTARGVGAAWWPSQPPQAPRLR